MNNEHKLDIGALDNFLLSKPGSQVTFPFGPDVKVYKVSGKMFALIRIHTEPVQINLKCDPLDALTLRNQFRSIIPGYHMNKDHWNTVILDNTIPPETIYLLADQSYRLIVKTLTKNQKKLLKSL